MAVTGLRRQLPQQAGVVDRQHLTRRRLDIELEIAQLGSDGVKDRRQLCRLGQIGGLRRLLRMAKTRLIEQHLMRFPPRQVREANRRNRALEGEEAVAPDASEAGKYFRQLLAAHAFYRIAPDTLNLADDCHIAQPPCLNFNCLTIPCGRCWYHRFWRMYRLFDGDRLRQVTRVIDIAALL